MDAQKAVQQIIDEHEVTRELKRLRVRKNELAKLRFFKHDDTIPFDAWAITGPRRIVSELHSLAKAYCALRWLLLENPPSSPRVEAAWFYVSQIAAAELIQRGVHAVEQQQIRTDKAKTVTVKYSDEQKKAWKIMAADPEFDNHSKKRTAEIIAERCKLDAAAVRTIRATI